MSRSNNAYLAKRHETIKARAPIGKKFGTLTVIGEPFLTIWGKRSSQKYTAVVCKCDCGDHHAARIAALDDGSVASCGCRQGNFGYKPSSQLTHGATGSRLYRIWQNMKDRCGNPKNKMSHRYGGRGIEVCKAWLDFTVFRDWAYATGYGDSLTIDRIDVDRGYSPDNCQWLTKADNCRKANIGTQRRHAENERLIDTLTVALIATLAQ